MARQDIEEQVRKSPTPRLPLRRWNALSSRFELPCFNLDEKLLYMGSFKTPGWYMPPHYHEHFELNVIAGGSGRFYTHNVVYHVKEGDLFLSKPGEHHRGFSDNDSPLQVYYFGFNPERFSSLLTSFYQINTCHVTGNRGKALLPLCEAMLAEAKLEKPFHTAAIHGMFLQLLAYALRIFQENVSTPGTQQGISKHVRQALEHIHRKPLTSASEMADHVHMSRSHLARLFRKEVGMSIGEYVRTIRLDQAKHLLKETDAPISAIADELGFASVHSFSSSFKRCTGKSPSEYRKLLYNKPTFDDEA
jgi:AraC-like DNA-binding protein/quercetin dioxygenase-like cupin family protein